jgi:hypothetical protein
MRGVPLKWSYGRNCLAVRLQSDADAIACQPKGDLRSRTPKLNAPWFGKAAARDAVV